MKTISILLVVLTLAGCSTTVPVTRKFPEIPTALSTACPDLKQAENSPKLSALVTTVTQNYELYKQCQIKMDTWNEWYQAQKQVFDSVK